MPTSSTVPAVEHNHVDLRSTPDQPLTSNSYRADCPACAEFVEHGHDPAYHVNGCPACHARAQEEFALSEPAGSLRLPPNEREPEVTTNLSEEETMTLTDPIRPTTNDRRPDCPEWCSEHTYDVIDGAFGSHTHQIPTDAKESWVAVTKEEDLPEAFIEVEVQGGNRWTASEVDALITSLGEAKRTLGWGANP